MASMRQRLIEELQIEAGEGGEITLREARGVKIHEGKQYEFYRGEEFLAKGPTLKSAKANAFLRLVALNEVHNAEVMARVHA